MADLAFIHNLAELALWTAGGQHAKPRFSWVYTDPDAHASLKYRVRVYKAPSGGAAIYDSGEVSSVVASGATMTHDATQGFVRGVAKAAANIIQNGSSADANNYVTASVTMRAGRVYLLSVENSKSSATADPISSITGGGGVPSFVSRATVPYNSSLNRQSIWSAVPTADYTGTLTINFGGVTQTGAVWSLDEYVAIDSTTTHGIVQSATGTGNSGTALATLAALASTDNPVYGAMGHAAATATTPGSGLSELADQTQATPAQALQTEHKVTGDTTVDATFTSAQWGACAVELQAAEWWWTVEVWDTLGESSGESSRTAFKVYWAQGLYEHNPGASSSAWSFANGAVAANTQAAFLFRSATSSGGEAASGKTAFSSQIGQVTIQAWAQVLVRLATHVAGTQPALPDMTFNYIGASTQPDRWTFSPSAEWSLDESVRRYGARALKCAVQSGTVGDRTAYAFRKTSGDDIPVVPNTAYIASLFVRTNAPLTGGSVRLELWSAGGVGLLAASASVTDTSPSADGWQRLTVAYTTGAGDTALRFMARYTRTSGVTETFWVDAAQLEEGAVATTWRAGQIGKALVIDVNGIVVDALAGGLARFRGSLGGVRDTFELGPHGLLLGGDVELYSDTANEARVGDGDSLVVTTGSILLGASKDVGLSRGAADRADLAAGDSLRISTTGSLDFVNARLRGAGTSFPGSPVTDDLFYRTDRDLLYFYDGTRWLTTHLYEWPVGFSDALVPFTATVVAARAGLPEASVYDLWLVELRSVFIVAAGGTALGASHKWVLTYNKQPAASLIATINIDSGASNVYRTIVASIGALLGTTNYAVDATATKTGTPGNLYAFGILVFRMVG